jgi:hypothetical protein
MYWHLTEETENEERSTLWMYEEEMMMDPDQDNADLAKQEQAEQDERDEAAQDWDDIRYWMDVMADPYEDDSYYDGAYSYPVEVM